MLSKNIHNFIACDAEYEDADIVLFGAGFDGTTSFRPGTRFGPSAIRNESFGIETYSPYQDKDMLDYSYFDSGDLELAFGSTNRVIADIAMRTDRILTDVFQGKMTQRTAKRPAVRVRWDFSDTP